MAPVNLHVRVRLLFLPNFQNLTGKTVCLRLHAHGEMVIVGRVVILKKQASVALIRKYCQETIGCLEPIKVQGGAFVNASPFNWETFSTLAHRRLRPLRRL
jgi:hypothetical protein